MIHPLVAMTLVLGSLGGLLVVLRLVDRFLHPPAELSRKLMHVGTGLIVLGFPWIFDKQWPVTVMSLIGAVMLLSLRVVPQFRGLNHVMSAVKRPSLGEIYFTLSVCLLFWLSDRDKLLYCVPVLIMTLADAMAALIGIAYGKVRYVTTAGLKSAEGSIAFFAIAFLSVHVPLLLFTNTGRAETLLIAIIIGILSMLLEACAWRGLDNLLIPLGAFAFLKLYLPMDVDDLTPRLAMTLGLLVFTLAWRRRASLDDSALVGGVLFGYGAMMLGGPTWLLGPVLLFLALVLVWPRAGEQRVHSVFALLSVITTALLWVALHVRDPAPLFFVGYAATFGAHLSIVGVSRSESLRSIIPWVGAGWVLALTQVIAHQAFMGGGAIIPRTVTPAALLVGVTVGAAFFYAFKPLIYGPRGSDTAIHFVGFLAGLLASIVAVITLLI